MLRFVCLFLVGVSGIGAHKVHMGSCPSHNGQQNFDINRFLGEWYVIQQSMAEDPCMMYTLTFERQGKIRVYETSYNSPNEVKFNNRKKLKFEGESTSHMRLYKSSILSTGESFTVLYTDYETYAVVYICDSYLAYHRESIEVWSRQPHLHPVLTQQVHTALSGKNIDLTYLHVVDQTSCRPTPSPGTPTGVNPGGGYPGTNIGGYPGTNTGGYPGTNIGGNTGVYNG